MDRRLVQHLPPEAQGARVGGDEFALLTQLSTIPATEALDLLQQAPASGVLDLGAEGKTTPSHVC